MAVNTELLRFGFKSSTEANNFSGLSPSERERFYKESLSSFASEMLSKWVISPPFFYRVQNGKLYVNSVEREEPAFQLFNPLEREGIARDSFLIIESFLVNNPNRVVLWQSPKGKGAFEGGETNEFTKVDYPFNQLIVYVNLGEKVMGISITFTNEDFLKHLFKDFYKDTPDERAKIYHYLSHPLLTNLSFEGFLGYLNSLPNIPIHWNSEKVFYVQDLLSEINYALTTGKTTRLEIYDKTIGALAKQLSLEREITTEAVRRGYLNLIYYHQTSTGQQRTDLSAGCGGGYVGRSEIENLLGIKKGLDFNPWRNILTPDSSIYRFLQGKFAKERKTWEYHEGECIICHKKSTKVGPCNICGRCEKNF